MGRSGWVMLWESNSQVAQVAWGGGGGGGGGWWGGFGSCECNWGCTVFLNARDEDIFEKQRQ